MLYREIPGIEQRVGVLGFGNFTFGANWWGDISDDEAVHLQNHAAGRGVNFFDSAPAYGEGRAEMLLGRTIREVGRDGLVISTKFGYDLSDSGGGGGGGSHRERPQDFSAAAIRRELEASLQRLGVEHVDLYQAHNLKLPQWPDDLADTMQRLMQEGKIGAWGVALGPAIGWREEGLRALDERAVAVQTVMNLYEQDPGRELCDAAVASGGVVIARVPTNSGMLDEEFVDASHRFDPKDHRKFRDRNWLTYGLEKNRVVRPMADDMGCSLRQFAFRWLLSQPGMASIEPNILNRRDIDDFADAADLGPLPDDVLARLGELYECDFGLGDEAHPCDLKSSVEPGGRVRSGRATKSGNREAAKGRREEREGVRAEITA